MSTASDVLPRRVSANAGDRSVLGRAFAILRTFDSRRSEVGLAELVDEVGLPKTTVHRLAGQLVELGALERGASPGCYRLGMALFELGTLVPSRRRLREMALPYIEDLYETTHETVHFGVLDQADVVYLERIAGHTAVSCPTRAGGRMPAYCTAIGKALLGFDPEAVRVTFERGLAPRTRNTIAHHELLKTQLAHVAETGLAFDNEEGELGVACVGAPVFNRNGQAVAGISVTHSPTVSRKSMYAGAVQATAISLTRAVQRMPDTYWQSTEIDSSMLR